MVFIERLYRCDNCKEPLSADEWEVPFQVGSKHYCNEGCALEHHHKEDLKRRESKEPHPCEPLDL